MTRPSFTFKNYYRMFKAKGIRLPFYYFFQAHFFDLYYGVDTHLWLPKDYIKQNNENLKYAEIYMASWTNEVKRIFKRVEKILGDTFINYKFIDIGCGKGKVGIIWTKLCSNKNIKQDIFGLDIVPELIEIAQQNHLKIYGTKGNYYIKDVTEINPKEYGQKFILYLYNPFDQFILNKLLIKFKEYETIIIYTNPVHHEFVLKYGFSKIFEHKGFHGNLNTITYKNQI
ncbi:methyltransferase domain-containing protein [Polynucleobacter rarus]|uniref:methyltransferase domain-containing protein n=1 Tax=Polynucleobacter rarus TaxID=556055 RepID=UPI000D3E402A|nr:methyltransferase domain-containing protein [Polynucleobacter rarus]